MPIGWDTPIYIYFMKLYEQGGFFSIIKVTSSPQLFSALAAGINAAVVHNDYLTIEMLPAIISICIVLLTALVLQEWIGDWRVSSFGAFMAAIDAQYFRLATDLYSNLLAWPLVLLLFLALALFLNRFSIKLIFAIAAINLLLLLVHFETWTFSVAVAAISVLTLRRISGLSNSQFSYGILALLVPPLIVLSAFSSDAVSYLTFAVNHLPYGGSPIARNRAKFSCL